MDALLGGGSASENDITARSLTSALGALIRRPSQSSLTHLYSLICDESAISIVDDFLRAVQMSRLRKGDIATVARYFATNSTDLNSVKLMVALLGISSGPADANLVQDLGLYEELTLYSAVTLSRIMPEPDDAIWNLAKHTFGWGRIQAIRRLRGPLSAEIRNWLLTEGYRNGVMVEEIAFHCAVEGRLLDELEKDDPPEVLLDGAGELLSALAVGGPAEDMDDYSDGAGAARRFMELVGERASNKLERYLQVKAILDFVSDVEADWATRAQRGWSAEIRWIVRTGASTFLARPSWRELAEAALQSDDRGTFWSATIVARSLGIDTWPHHLRRQRDIRSGEWYFLMQTDDLSRITQVIDLAIEQLDLKKVGSGPTTSLGLGPDFEDDSAVDFILQDLRRFPGVGWPILEVGLRARTVRARNMAHRALEAWDRATWPTSALPALRAALDKEPDGEVAKRTLSLIEGRPLL